MKLFRYAASLVALAMLGACSSEEPIPGNGGKPAEGEQGMYLSINVKGQETTRGTKPAEAAEKTISKIQIIVNDKNGKNYIDQTIRSTDQIEKEDGTKVDQITGSTILFTVDNTTFNEMKLHAGEDWEILVYVNGADTNYAGIMTGKTDAKTWGIENATGDGYNTRGFAMSNASKSFGKLESIGTNDGKTPEKAWQIKADVTLSRLATRFDYVKNTTTNNNYTLLSDNKVKLEIVGMGVNTFANNTFRIAQFSSDGQIPAGGVKDCTHFENNEAGTLFRVTDVYNVTSENVDFPSSYLGQDLWLIPGTKETIYARPNTIYQGTALSYEKVPYAVVKAKITVDGAGTDTSFGKNEDLFAMNGILIGGARDLKALDTAGEEFAVEFDDTNLTPDEKKDIEDRIQEVVDAVNNFIKGHTFKDLSVTANLNEENNNIATFLQAERYKYDNDAKGYFTYYASYIRHSSNDKDDDAWKYGVSRNTVYQLGVDSFGFLGNNGSGKIGEGPKPSKVQDLIMKLTVTVSDWELNDVNKGWKF